MSSKRFKWLFPLFGIVLLSACLSKKASHKSEVSTLEKEHPLQGITNFANKKVTLPALENKITVLDFWASWCGPCKEAFPYFDQMQRKFGKKKLQVIAVSLDEDQHDAIRFKNRLRPSFKTFWDPENILSDRFSVQALPTTIILDSSGEIVHRHSGFDLRSHLLLEAQVRSFIDEIP